jgi:hypothetical protein
MTERRTAMSTDYDEQNATADAFIVLAEMARERGLDRVADLGDLPPLDLKTRNKYLEAARRRQEQEEVDGDERDNS